MDRRIRLLSGLLAGCVALAAFCLGAALRSDGQHLSQFATGGGVALACAGGVWWCIERRWRRERLRLQEAERMALARELHDEFGQNLAAMVTAAGFLERHAATASGPVVADCARDMLGAAAQMARQLRGHLQRLHPQGVQGASLRAALEALLQGHWLSAAGLRVEARWPALWPALSPEAGLALYRTVQEALTNVVRHAGAQRVVVSLDTEGAGLRLCIDDDGCGVVPATRAARRAGLMGMRERAAMVGGRLVLQASDMGGLQVRLWLPAIDRMDKPQGDKNHGECAAAG